MPKQVRTPEQQTHRNTMKRIRAELSIAVDEVLGEIEPQIWAQIEANPAIEISVSPQEARRSIRGLLDAPTDH